MDILRSTRLVYTGFLGELEHLKTKTRLIDEMFGNVMGECVRLKPRVEESTCSHTLG
jgi:hypothetical protein